MAKQSQFSIAEAKDGFTQVVQQAEEGVEIHITRRGRPVAVLVSEQIFEKLTHPREGIGEFLRQWRSEMVTQGIEFPDGNEFEGLRDNSQRPDLRF